MGEKLTWQEAINRLAASAREERARREAAEAEEAKREREEAIEDAFDTLISYGVTPGDYHERFERVMTGRAGS